jgi:hypothetical protein
MTAPGSLGSNVVGGLYGSTGCGSGSTLGLIPEVRMITHAAHPCNLFPDLLGTVLQKTSSFTRSALFFIVILFLSTITMSLTSSIDSSSSMLAVSRCRLCALLILALL